MFGANSYVDPLTAAIILDCIHAIGIERVFLLGMIACLRLNLNLPWLDADIRTMVDVWRARLSLSSAEQVVVGMLLKQAFSLNKTFTSQTNKLFFQYINCTEE